MRKLIKGLLIIGIIALGAFGTCVTARGEDNILSVGSEQELAEALNHITSGVTIKLEADIEYTSSIIISDMSITFDLNGYKLYVHCSGTALAVHNGGSVQLGEEGELNVCGSSYGVWADNGSSVDVTNVTVESNSCFAICASSNSTVRVHGAVEVRGDYAYGIKVNSGGSVIADHNVTLYGLSGTGLTSSTSGNITIQGDVALFGNSCNGVYAEAYDSNTTYSIMGNIIAEGDYCHGIYSSSADSIINIGGNISGEGLYFTGIYNTGSTITVAGDINASGYVSTGAYAANETSLITIRGNVNADGEGCTGLFSRLGASIVIDNNIVVEGEGCLGASTDGGTIHSKGNIQGSGSYCAGARSYVSSTAGGYIEVAGNIAINGQYSRGIDAYGDGILISSIKVVGSISADGQECKGIYNYGGDITSEGDVTSDGKGCYGIEAYGGTVTVNGSVRITGDPTDNNQRSKGILSIGTGSLVTIKKNVNAIGEGCTAVDPEDTGKVIVEGDITTEGPVTYGIYIYDSGTAEVSGNVIVRGDYGCGVNIRKGIAILRSDIIINGIGGTGSYAEAGSIQVDGSIKVIGSYGEGAIVTNGGLTTVEGVIEAATYVVTDTTPRQIANGVLGTGENINYVVYSSGSNIIRVRKQLYTVSYYANGGTGTAPATATVNNGFSYKIAAGSLTAPAGKRFKEWNTDPLGTGTPYSANANVIISENLTLYAIWILQSYNITVQYDVNGTGSAAPPSATVGQTVTLSAVPKSGYRLKEWQIISPSGLTVSGNSFSMPASAVIVKAIFVKVYSITLQTNGNGTVSAVASNVAQGETVTLTAIPNSHYHLKEWQVIAPRGLTITGSTFVMPAQAVTLKAIFEKDSYNIIIQNDSGGTAAASRIRATQGQAVTLTAYPNSHYHFKEWQVITPVSLTVTGNTFIMPEEEVNIKAIFEKDSYDITIQSDGEGTAEATLLRATQGETVTLIANPSIHSHLKEWQVITPVTLTVTGNTFIMPEEEVILKAVFEKDSYDITIQSEGGGTAEASVSRAMQGEAVTLTAYPNSHYHLEKWQVLAPVTLTVTGDTFIMPEEEVTIKAVFVPTEYKITFMVGGNVYAEKKVQEGNTLGNLNWPEDPKKSGYTFMGWYSGPQGIGSKLSSSSLINSSITVHAKWSLNEVTDMVDQKKEEEIADFELPVKESLEILGATGGTGTLSAHITGESVSQAIEAAKHKAEEGADKLTGIELEVDIKHPDKEEIASLNIVLEREAIQKLLQDKVNNLQINGGILSIDFDLEVLSEISKSSSGDVTLSIIPNSRLSFMDGEKASLRVVYDIEISYQDNGNGQTNQVTDMKQGTILISVPYVLREGEDSSELYAVYINKNGERSFIQNSYYDTISKSLIFTTKHLSTYGIAYRESPVQLSDIDNYWGKESIQYIVNRGMLGENGAAKFSPEEGLTREELAKALAILCGAAVSNYPSSSFKDVAMDSEYMPYIEWAYTLGIIDKKEVNLFAPTMQLTRGELAVILGRFAKATAFDLPRVREAYTFYDLSGLDSAGYSTVNQVVQAGIMAEKKAHYFNPKDYVTRGDAAVILSRYLKLNMNKQSSQGWSQNDKGQLIYYSEGKRLVGWQILEGRKYYFSKTGILKEGWKQEGSDKYYLTADGAVTGWWKVKGNNYYFSEDGKMVYGKWIKIKKKWYYFNEDGTLAVNTTIDGYTVDHNGVRVGGKGLK